VVETQKPVPLSVEDVLEEMRRETDVILAKSAKLIKDMEELHETGRELRAAQEALLEQRRKNKTST
jgi:hypothetical protein